MLLEVVVPEGMQPGDTFMVEAPGSDQQFSVVVPEGVWSGDAIEIDLPVDNAQTPVELPARADAMQACVMRLEPAPILHPAELLSACS